ncbi:MAG: ribosome maturation factor RimM [Armatimonadota bacterium]
MNEARDFIKVGQIVGPHGLKGGVRVMSLTDFPERFVVGAVLFVEGRRHVVRDSAWHKGQVRLHLSGLRKMEEAEALKWAYLEVPSSSLPKLEEGEYMTADLIGLTAITPEGDEIGKVDDIVHAPAHDLIQVGDAMVPAVKEFVKQVDLEKGTITLALIPGMLGEDE